MGKAGVRKLNLQNIQEINSFEGYKLEYDEETKSYFIRKHMLSKKNRDRGFQKILKVEELGGNYFLVCFLYCEKQMNMIPEEIGKAIDFFYWKKVLYFKITRLDDSVALYDYHYNRIEDKELLENFSWIKGSPFCFNSTNKMIWPN